MSTNSIPASKRWFSKAWLLEQKSLIALLLLIVVVSTLSPNFFTLNNIFNILQQTSVNAIMAVGMTLVILTSGIDLSVGSLPVFFIHLKLATKTEGVIFVGGASLNKKKEEMME